MIKKDKIYSMQYATSNTYGMPEFTIEYRRGLFRRLFGLPARTKIFIFYTPGGYWQDERGRAVDALTDYEIGIYVGQLQKATSKY